MANTTTAFVCLLFLVSFSALFVSSQARVLHGYPAPMQENTDSQRLWHKLGFHLSQDHDHYRRLADLGPDRHVPEGPDHQHHL
ncbi:CLAVATA3/ESR (CLE)-related protein 5 [Morella rubra]|uniref:CLAVATA3/ESR (CLE)-related protein 5 n=1 Tax=Morella rubra TaxID=262757 RepID=A0A6A1VHR2_9ROSI|nr:CLAVATA3/ESR (CLE)-related protein 5 [Morella rubra]KAB1212419.1 CLAVATA3/ESR (CLE)-related protein 5 [Morella rubra]